MSYDKSHRYIALILAPLLVAACAERDAPPAGAGAGAHAPAQRVISLIPSTTETILALGGGDRLVARSDYDNDAALAHLPSVGRALTPSLEQLTVLQPDLVIAWPDNMSRSVIGRLGELGVQIYAPEIQTLADIYETTSELGRRLGLEAAADSVVADIKKQLEAVSESTAGREHPSIFYVVWHDPPTTVGPATFINELIEIAGGRNVFADAPAQWPQVSLETIVSRQPDVIVLPSGDDQTLDLRRLRARVGWRDMRAVREGRVIHVDAELFNRPGPRVAEAARQLAQLLRQSS